MKRPALMVLGGAVFVLTATAGLAQSGSDGSPEANKTTSALEEVVVTARKRSESLLEVPVVANVLTSDALESYSTHDLYMVAQRVPALVLGDSLAANGVQVTMRGVGTTANNATIDQSVALNVDGVQLTQGLSYNIGMFDVGQVEVLKGPQALFFGKNSPAGVISLGSMDPTDETEVSASLGYESEAQQMVGELILSGPVSEALKLRLSARYSDMEGFFRNEAVPIPGLGGRNPLERDVAPTEDLILRGTALFEPSDALSARLKVNYEDLSITGPNPASQIVYCPEGTNGVPPLNIAFIGQDDCKLDETIYLSWPDPAAFPGISNNGEPFFGYEQVLTSLELNFKLNDALTLTSLTGYHQLDEDYLFVASVISASTILMSDSEFETDQFTQEFRLTSDYADRSLNYMVGAFYQNANQKPIVHLRGNTFFRFPATLQRVTHDIDIESVSLFGQLTWDITPELEFAPGVRWTDEKRTDTQTNYNPGSGPVGNAPILDPEIDSSNVSPEVTLTYRPTDDLMLYAAYKTGFKSGSFNGVVYAPPTTPISFDDEEVKGGEAGLKARLMDQVSLNLTGYYYDYSNLQVGANEINGATGALQLRTLNAASAEVYGIDFDATYVPEGIEGLTLSTAVAYTHARYEPSRTRRAATDKRSRRAVTRCSTLQQADTRRRTCRAGRWFVHLNGRATSVSITRGPSART